MPSEDDSAGPDKELPTVGSQLTNTQSSFASRAHTHMHDATYSMTQTASSMAPSIGK